MKIENILTVDLEDWYHVCGMEGFTPPSVLEGLESRIEGNTSRILDFLSRMQVKVTFFVLSSIAEKFPDLIRRISRGGHEIATHGYSHRQVYTMTPGEFREDVERSVDIISGITGVPVRGYRAPEWSIRDDSLWALDILGEKGFEYDSSMAPLPIIGNQAYSRRPWRIRVNGGSLWEFPPLVASTPFSNLPLGGGWGLRIFPYSMIRTKIRKLNRQGHPALIYLHPREFDRNVPKIPLPLIKRVVLNARIETAEKRLMRLLKDFRFTSVADALRKETM